MKAVVFHHVGDIRLEDVPEPKIEQPADAIVRLTASAICGTDLHFVRGTFPGMKEGAVLGVYPPSDNFFPIGMAMNKNLTIRMGNCNHRKYIPRLIELIQNGSFDPTQLVTKVEKLDSVMDACKAFDTRRAG